MDLDDPLMTLTEVSSAHEVTLTPIVENISITIPRGTIVTFASSNENETTILLQMLAGHLKPTQGTITRAPEIDASPASSIAGVFAEKGFFPELSLFDNLFLGTPATRREIIFNRTHLKLRVQKLYEELGFNLTWHQVSDGLSPQERMAASIVRVLLRQASLYIFDQVFQVLDEESRRRIFEKFEQLAQQGATVIFSIDKYDDLMVRATHAVLLSCGQIRFMGQLQGMSREAIECHLINNASSAKHLIIREINRFQHENTQPLIFLEKILELLSFFLKDHSLYFAVLDSMQTTHFYSYSPLQNNGDQGMENRLVDLLVQNEEIPDIIRMEKTDFHLFSFTGKMRKTEQNMVGTWVGILALSGPTLKYKFPLQAFIDEWARSFKALCGEFDLDQRLKHRQRLDSLGLLAGGVAHDFNNSLCALLGAAQLIKAANTNPNLDQFLDTVLAAGNDAKLLTNKLLSFSKKGGTEFVSVDLHQIINDTTIILRRGTSKKIKISLALNAQESLVLGDAAELKNVILNLGLNALHAVDAFSGRVWISTANVHHRQDEVDNDNVRLPQHAIVLTVLDNGPGIRSDAIDRIFEPFFSTKLTHGGTGLGLSVVYGTVKEHNGSIAVINEVYGGARFSLSFPITKHDSPSPALQESQILSGSGHILLCDDDKRVNFILSKMLEKLGYSVVTTTSGADCLNVFSQSQSHFSLILLDDLMPGMTGRECFYQLKKIQPDVKVLLVTGYRQVSSIPQLQQDGLCGVLRKPVTLLELSKCLFEILSKEKST